MHAQNPVSHAPWVGVSLNNLQIGMNDFIHQNIHSEVLMEQHCLVCRIWCLMHGVFLLIEEIESPKTTRSSSFVQGNRQTFKKIIICNEYERSTSSIAPFDP